MRSSSSLSDSRNDVFRGFKESLESVDRLINLDREITQLVLTDLTNLQYKLKKAGLDNPVYNVRKTIDSIETIRKHDSLRSRYETVTNQALVLLVSYFGSALSDLFRICVLIKIDADEDSDLLNEEIKLTIRELKGQDRDLRESIPDILVAQRDISFQDMGSWHRAAARYMGIKLCRDQTVNDIIAAQACRHVIVHSGSVVTERLLSQVKDAHPRKLRCEFELGKTITFSTDEISTISESMQAYISLIVDKIAALETGKL